MLAAAIVPGPPLLIPALAGPAAYEAQPVRDAAIVAARRLGRCTTTWVTIYADDAVAPRSRAGSCRELGVDEVITLAPDADDAPDSTMPTPLLVAGWLRQHSSPSAHIYPCPVPRTATTQQCRNRAEDIANSYPHEVGILVIADGSSGLTARAPSSLISDADVTDRAVAQAIASGNYEAVMALDIDDCAHACIDGRAPLQVAAQLWTLTGSTSSETAPVQPSPAMAETLYSGAPFGVGYHVGWWSQ